MSDEDWCDQIRKYLADGNQIAGRVVTRAWNTCKRRNGGVGGSMRMMAGVPGHRARRIAAQGWLTGRLTQSGGHRADADQ